MASDKSSNKDLDPVLTENPFCKQIAAKSLRICCYGSSSAKTPERFTKEAFALGYILAKRGHTCVNGAGSFGCMVSVQLQCVILLFVIYSGLAGKKREKGCIVHSLILSR